MQRIRYGSLMIEDRAFTYRHGVESFTLANGLTVALVPDRTSNLVSVDVRYRAGAAADPENKAGLAHVVEHATFERRDQPDGPTLANQLALAALHYNAATTWDATHYSAVALSGQLDAVLAIEANRMAGGCAGLDAATFERERVVVAQELAQRAGGTLLPAVLGDVFGDGHRYTAGLGGREVGGITLADACGFLRAYYGPAQAILVISGRFDPEATRRTLATQFASIPRHAATARPPLRRAVLAGGTSEHRADVEEATAIVVFPVAPWGSPESFDDDLIDALLINRLARLDREERWITGFDADRLGGLRIGARYFAVSVADPNRLDEAVAKIYAIAGELPGPDSHLALGVIAARRRAALFGAFESIFERGEHCADYLQLTRHGRFHLAELDALQTIDTDRLAVRAKLLTRAASHVIRVLPSQATDGKRAARPVLEAALEIDAPVWHAPVDPADAERPLALPEQRPASAVTELRLSNGLRVVMAPGFSQPVIDARLVFPAGSFNVPPGQRALVSAAAELLEPNPRLFRPKDYVIYEWVLRLGGQLSADVDDATTFRVWGSSTFADWHVWRLGSLIEAGGYDPDDVERVRDAAERRAARVAADGARSQRWRQALRKALFGVDHPYARDRISFDEIDAISVGDLMDFRDAHYRASAATLIVVGDFEVEEMTKTINELFGTWSSERPAPTQPPPPMHPRLGPTWLAHGDPDATQVEVELAFVATSVRESSRGARAVVAEMVHNRLAEIRTRLAASYGVHSRYQASEAGDVLTAGGYVDAQRAGEVVRVMQQALDGLRTGDAALAADFVRARRAALARALAAPVITSAVADELQDAVVKHRPLDDASTLPAAIAATTLVDARAVIAADLQPARMVGLLNGRSIDVAAAFATAGITRVVPAEALSKH